jgi:hypothetical protein
MARTASKLFVSSLYMTYQRAMSSNAAILHLPTRVIISNNKADKFFPCLEQKASGYKEFA